MTVRELADRVLDERSAAWGRSDPKTAIVATDQLGPADEQAVRRVVAGAGYSGAEQDEMVRQVSARVVAMVEGLADSQPATGGD
ncbi:MAG TPA: hypothetical protein VM533_21470 [Fimbriiglobus sp.]|jgi:hypothetical protein|nr:hypothetical protein [Fimbriiglobus sp.]